MKFETVMGVFIILKVRGFSRKKHDTSWGFFYFNLINLLFSLVLAFYY